MIWIERPHTDPWFNLAAEEYILKHTQEDVLMFWQNTSSVVVGKHQNTAAEVNLSFTDNHKIPVIRRISGGGTVYHDLGNINYTLIRKAEKNEFPVDFKAFTQPLIAFLKSYGLEARFEGKNNLRIHNKKFSGNAAHVYKNRVMHHGTLLFDTDLNMLEKIIQNRQEQFSDRAIKSVRAKVGNLSEFLPGSITQITFKEQFQQFLHHYFNIESQHQLSDEETKIIAELAETRYKSWEWNIGYSPQFSIQKTADTPYGIIRAKLRIKSGHIVAVDLFFEDKKLIKIEKQLMGQAYRKAGLLKILADNRFSETLVNTLF
jgi:lipoate-protein ligase A